jgi:hypothetical protein
MSTDETRRRAFDFLARDFDSLLSSMRELIPTKLPEWREFRSEADFGNVLLQLFAHMGDIVSYYQDRVASESFLASARSRRSVIDHLGLIGYKLATAAPATAALTLSVPGTCNEVITIRRGDAFATKSEQGRPSIRFEFNGMQDLVIDCAAVPAPPAPGRKVFPAIIPVEEGRLVAEELVGISDGAPFQKFRLAHPGLILRGAADPIEARRDITVVTQLGAEITEWSLQESLAFSREGSHDYVCDIDAEDRASIGFGDDTLGAIPPAGSQIKVTYRHGGGKHGNTAADTIRTIVAAPTLVSLGAKVTNPAPATGGAERETIEHAALHAPQVFRSFKRAVTADDYRALALRFPGVGKVRAQAANWNRVRLFVAPAGGGQVSDQLEAGLLAYFESKRSLSTIVEIEDADYVRIYVRAEIGIGAFYSKAEIRQKAAQAVSQLIAFENVDFGKPVYLSKFYEVLEAIVGVEFVNITEFRREGELVSVNPLGKITLGPNEIPKVPDVVPEDGAYLTGADLVIEGGF